MRVFLKEFVEFLKEYKVIGVAIAFIMGFASTAMIKSLVDNIIMPLVTPFVQNGAWKEATLALGPFVFKWGAFLADVINFVIIALAVFLVAKFVLREMKVAKK